MAVFILSEEFMQDNSIFSWLANGLIGIVLYFMRTTANELKEQIKEQRKDLEVVKETYNKKADFTEFKIELWARLDEMKSDFQRALDKK